MASPLPFLDEKKQSGGVVGSTTIGVDPGLTAAAFELIKAIEAKDTAGVARALKNAFELCDSQPHEEGPHWNRP